MMLPRALDVLLVVACAPVLVACAYLLALALASRRRAPPGHGIPRLRFDVIIPAHDEESGIGETVRSALAVDYPAHLRRVVVVADNCSDATAARAAAAGALVLERSDASRRGKGFALSFAFEHSARAGFADAVVVIDADTQVSGNLLRALQARLDAGALAVQTNNVVGNPGASWRTCLMAIAFALFNTVRSLGRERLGCSVGLRGNGMCLRSTLLEAVPHDAFSVVEDLEYGIRVGLAGHRVHFAPEAFVASVMVSSASGSRSQRQRWEGGRRRLAQRHGWPLVVRGLVSRDRVLLDLGIDLLVPPLATVAATALGGWCVSAAAAALTGVALVAPWVWGACAVSLTVYVLRGWWVSGTGAAGLQVLLHAPLYVAWKLTIAHTRRASTAANSAPETWIRTARERT